VIFVCYFTPCLKACRLEIQIARSVYQASNELLVCPTLSQFAVFIQATNKQVDCMLLAFHGLINFYKESVEPDKCLNTASYTHLPLHLSELWSEVTSTGFMTIRQQGDLLRLWEISGGRFPTHTDAIHKKRSCSLFHCHEITHNPTHNALVHTNSRFTKLSNFDHAMKTLYTRPMDWKQISATCSRLVSRPQWNGR